jgi:hypothetical protein
MRVSLQAMVREHVGDERWGTHAQRIESGDMWCPPRGGGHDDRAHPPIHPTRWTAGQPNWHPDKARLYEFIVRSFLASCSKAAVGFETRVDVRIAEENFSTTGEQPRRRADADIRSSMFDPSVRCWPTLMSHLRFSELPKPDRGCTALQAYLPLPCVSGLVVKERNWMEVFPWARWGGNDNLPDFTVNQAFIPTELLLKEAGRIQSSLHDGGRCSGSGRCAPFQA